MNIVIFLWVYWWDYGENCDNIVIVLKIVKFWTNSKIEQLLDSYKLCKRIYYSFNLYLHIARSTCYPPGGWMSVKSARIYTLIIFVNLLHGIDFLCPLHGGIFTFLCQPIFFPKWVWVHFSNPSQFPTTESISQNYSKFASKLIRKLPNFQS